MELTADNEHVEILCSLGLRLSEAKILLALSELGPAPVGLISKKSEIAREFVYRIIPKLVNRGLVEEILAMPKKYKATPIEETYKVLLRRKEEENRKLYLKAMRAIKRRKSRQPLRISDKTETRLILSREAPDTRISEEFKTAKESIDFTFPTGKFLQWSQYYAKLSLKGIPKRKLKIRIITQQRLFKILENHPNLLNADLRSKLKHVNFKYSQKPFSVEMMIFDKKTLFISTKKTNDINKMIWLRTNNPIILEMANYYYEALWEESSKTVINIQHGGLL